MIKKTVCKENFGKRLSQLMEEYNETTYSMAERFSLSSPTISRYMTGQMAAKVTTIQLMAEYFHVNDADGKLVSHSYFLYCDNKDLRSEVKCIYNHSGQVVQRVLTNTDKNKVVYKEVTDWNPDNKQLIISKYDDKDGLLERWEGNSDGLPDSWKIDDYCIEEGEINLKYRRDDSNL